MPMTGAVLHSINTRLDPPVVAFMLDHANTKLIIVDTEFAPIIKEALAADRGRSRRSSTTATLNAASRASA